MASAQVALPTQFNGLTETEQRQVAERIIKIQQSGWRPFWCKRADCDGMPHVLLMDVRDPEQGYMYMHPEDTQGPNGEPLGEPEDVGDGLMLRPVYDPVWSHNHARADQRLPPWRQAWQLFIMSGRGTGKTTTGTEFVTLSARKGLDGAIIGRRGTELENTHVATIIARAHPEFRPDWFSSKQILVWPNKAVTYVFSAEKPENIRSVNLSYYWFDEAAFMDEIEVAYMNAELATRIETPGNPIHKLITSTPTSTPWVAKMEDDPKIEVRRVSTYANRANLSADYMKMLEDSYEGTRMGRQELHGEVLRDVEGALWNDSLFRHMRLDVQEYASLIDSMDDCALAIDPAGSKGKRSDATGIIGVGTQRTDDAGMPLLVSQFYSLCDATLKGSPTEWARQAFKAARSIKARRIVVEKNFGADMVTQVMKDFAVKFPDEALDHEGEPYVIKTTHAVLSKETRAEGTVARYEQGRVWHVSHPGEFGDLSMLEKEQVGWVPKSRGGKFPSPNRIDALVWAVREVDTSVKHAGQVANSREVLSRMKQVHLPQVVEAGVPALR